MVEIRKTFVEICKITLLLELNLKKGHMTQYGQFINENDVIFYV